MIGFILLTHRVEDFDQWKRVFDGSESLRREYGLLGGWIAKKPGDPLELTVILMCEDIRRAQQFMQLSQVREGMRLAGVTGETEVRFLEEVQPVSDVAMNLHRP